MSSITSYEQAVAEHRWEVPERFNIATDVCDKHPREKLAMIHEDPQGNVRRVAWGLARGRIPIADLRREFGHPEIANTGRPLRGLALHHRHHS